MNEMNQLFTIGHSNQSQEEFLAMLHRYSVNCVVDVRSTLSFRAPYLTHFLSTHALCPPHELRAQPGGGYGGVWAEDAAFCSGERSG